jgi:hypothetical protein
MPTRRTGLPATLRRRTARAPAALALGEHSIRLVVGTTSSVDKVSSSNGDAKAGDLTFKVR